MSGPRLLLDEHVTPRAAQALRRRGIDAVALRDWRGGAFVGRSDEHILAGALDEGRAFVTYDLRTIPPLVRRLAERSAPHAGVVLVSSKTIPPGDVRRLVRGLGRLADQAGDDLHNQVVFLTT